MMTFPRASGGDPMDGLMDTGMNNFSPRKRGVILSQSLCLGCCKEFLPTKKYPYIVSFVSQIIGKIIFSWYDRKRQISQ